MIIIEYRILSNLKKKRTPISLKKCVVMMFVLSSSLHHIPIKLKDLIKRTNHLEVIYLKHEDI